jgi:frataxin
VSSSISKGFSPETDNPPPKTAGSGIQTQDAIELTNEQYHELSDWYMDKVVARLEDLQEERADVDVEFSVS